MDIRIYGSTSQMVNIFIPDTSSPSGAGRTGLTNNSTNLAICVRREKSATETLYKQSDGNIEQQATVGTYQAPSSASKCRFRETPNPGQYEIQFHDNAGHFVYGDGSQKLYVRVAEIGSSALNIGPNVKEIQLIHSYSQLYLPPSTWEYTLTDEDTGDPIVDAEAWVTSDIDGNTILESGRTNAQGKVVFHLTPGTYYIWRRKPGWKFVNPDIETVT